MTNLDSIFTKLQGLNTMAKNMANAQGSALFKELIPETVDAHTAALNELFEKREAEKRALKKWKKFWEAYNLMESLRKQHATAMAKKNDLVTSLLTKSNSIAAAEMKIKETIDSLNELGEDGNSHPVILEANQAIEYEKSKLGHIQTEIGDVKTVITDLHEEVKRAGKKVFGIFMYTSAGGTDISDGDDRVREYATYVNKVTADREKAAEEYAIRQAKRDEKANKIKDAECILQEWGASTSVVGNKLRGLNDRIDYLKSFEDRKSFVGKAHKGAHGNGKQAYIKPEKKQKKNK